jgi:hypothetical protein
MFASRSPASLRPKTTLFTKIPGAPLIFTAAPLENPPIVSPDKDPPDFFPLAPLPGPKLNPFICATDEAELPSFVVTTRDPSTVIPDPLRKPPPDE